MKIAEGSDRIGSDIVNSYLVVARDGVTINDAGLPRYWTLLHRELARPKPAPFTLEPREATASLNRIEGVDVTWVVPGHGPTWDGGVTEAVRLIRHVAGQ
ncbi:hypothetical protein FNH05_25245 [Amycolatopsis rhizosphaerae]|uniref:MBL fold metallo-hydrolase n=1 Tax=Amycolatopsis rhizosphaerae TaxID=2053003 RepID=A0A558BJZ6_9PSEU|nr:hypothetical protein [Amycolatopsis rhizosphaerae]TVT36815.1 hypothetical protein FNH05_25245 [Amycolatopsis rhizosphaerae]